MALFLDPSVIAAGAVAGVLGWLLAKAGRPQPSAVPVRVKDRRR